MATDIIIAVVIGFIFGLFVAVFVAAAILGTWFIGSLNEDRSIPDEPYYFMEISRGGADKMRKNKHVLLKVKRENYVKDTK